MCVDGTALPFQVDPVLFQNPPVPYSLILLRNVTWLNTAVCHFTFESQTREPVNTHVSLFTALWAVRIQVLDGTRIQLVKESVE